MTYTFKLSRRLAVARVGSLVLLTGLLACSASDAPVGLQSQNPLDYSLATVHLSPSSVTAEVNQPVKLAAFGRNSLGDSMVVSDLSWSASGGTISPDGTFSAGMPGRYTLTASSQHGQKTGHGTVVVLAPPVGLSAVVVSPDTATLYTHEQRAFTAIGQMSDGSEAVIGVTWSASGGTIDAGGLYTAGASGGTFRIVATNGSSGYADTAVVTILAPVVDTAQADSSQTGGGADAATVDSVVIAPSAIALGSGTTQQFTATRYFSDGTHQLGGVSYSATGGTVSSSGLYTAGQVAGSYYVIATDQNSTQNDTASVTIQAAVTPPHDAGSGACANEPAGFTAQTDRHFSALDEQGWTNTSNPNLQVVTSGYGGAAPRSGPAVGRIHFPAGFREGGSPAHAADADLPGTRDLFLCTWVQLSSNWYGNAANSKIGYIWTGGKPKIYFNFVGKGYDDQHFRLKVQDMNVDPATTVNNLADPALPRGVWHKLEILVRSNTYGEADGRIRAWVDGSAVLDLSGVNFNGGRNTPSPTDTGWSMVEWNPIWGGMNTSTPTIPADQYMYMDDLHVSGR